MEVRSVRDRGCAESPRLVRSARLTPVAKGGSFMTAVAEEGGASPKPEEGRRLWAAYRRVNWLLAHAGMTLTSAGVPPDSPEVQAIRRALRAVNIAGGIENERK